MGNLKSIFLSPFAERFILVTGLINLTSALLLLFTCRFIPHFGPTGGWMSHNWYKFLYKYHSYAWWLFAPSLTLHVIFTITHVLLGG